MAMRAGRVRAGWKKHVMHRCVEKVAHPDKASALATIAEVGERALGAEPYRCELCDNWHWGTPSKWPAFPLEIIAKWRPWVGPMRTAYEAQRQTKVPPAADS